MISRRRALVAVGTAAFGGIGWYVRKAHHLKRFIGSFTTFTVHASAFSKPADQHLSAELARIGSRVYSEEGVPMFLACENLAEIGATHKQEAVPSALNRKVASAFRRYANEWQQLRPDASAGDVAKIVELVADKDFASGGTEVSL